ncbi:MAG: DUF4118 domain-containing protein [Anaerolineales bacterium]|nr:DUF4118 domain-containing protein [Anaerolineales bacterium]
MNETNLRSPSRNRRWNTLWRYLWSVLLVLLASAISFPVHFIIKAENLVMLYLAAVVLAAVFLGRGPAILASVLSVLTFDFFLVEPRLSLSIADTQYLLTFFGLLAVGLVISTTVAQLRSQVEIIRQREAHTAALNSLSKDLTGAVELDDMLRSVVQHIHQSFNSRVVVLLPGQDGLCVAADSSAEKTLPAADLAKAEALFRNHPGTPDPSAPALGEPSQLHYLPLRTSFGLVGILGIDSGNGGQAPASETQRDLLRGFANLAALAIERTRLAEQASQAQVLQNTERLQHALLSSISHELRTPLVSITGALSTLLEATPADSPAQQSAHQELVETAYEEAQHMNLLVGNLLDMSRLESGALRLSLEPCDLEDLAGIAIARFGERRHNRTVQTSFTEYLPLVDLDVNLMVEVLVNLLKNAAKYSPEASVIELACFQDGEFICIEVSDQGVGIPLEDLERVFDKFYRSPRVRHVAGLGLGLSISKGIVEAHGGSIQARNRPEGGLAITLRLPLTQKGISE